MSTVKNYLSLIKFSHTIFAMPFAMIGFFLGVIYPAYPIGQWNLNRAIGWERSPLPLLPNLGVLVLVLGCMVFARSAAMAFNRYLDEKFDALNPRTAIREIPAGIISKNNALRFVIFNCLAFIVCTWFLNPLCFA